MSYNHEDLGNYSHAYVNDLKKRIADLEASAAAPSGAEPVAEVIEGFGQHDKEIYPFDRDSLVIGSRLYLAPPASTQQIRDAALEECLKLVTLMAISYKNNSEAISLAREACHAIRALKSEHGQGERG